MLQATRAGISAFAEFSHIATGLGVSRAVLADGLRALTGTGPARPCAHYTGPVSGSTAEPGHQAGACWALALLTEASRGGSAAAAAGPLGQYRGRPRQPKPCGMTSTPPSTEATMTSLDRRADVSHEGKERTPIAMSIPATMCALQQTSLNGPEDLRLITGAPVPNPGPGEVLIRVTAAGVNFVDISQARGIFAGGPQPPYLAGIEGAGEITAVGEGVTGLEPGAHVIGVGIGGGAFAEYMVLPAAAAVRVPAGWADEQALGLVVSWPTALAALKPLGCIAAGQTVLIHAAAGGTGQAAVKVAKHYGATVIAAASPGKHEVVRALGADHVVDSRGADLAAEVLRLTGGAGADLVLESVGGATLEASLAAAKRVTGRVVVYGQAGGPALRHGHRPLSAGTRTFRSSAATRRRRYGAGPVSAGKPEIRSHRLRAHPGRVLRHSSPATGSGVYLHTVTTRQSRDMRYPLCAASCSLPWPVAPRPKWRICVPTDAR